MRRIPLLLLLAISARTPAAAQTRSAVSSTAPRLTLMPPSVSVSFQGVMLAPSTALTPEIVPALAAAPAPFPQAAVATPAALAALAAPAPLPRALLDTQYARIVSASGPGVELERLAPVERALKSVRRLRELLDPESPSGAEGMAAAAAELDALLQGAPQTRELSDLRVRAVDRSELPFSVPWPRYYAGLLRQAPKTLAASRPAPGGGWRGALDRIVFRRAESAFWRRLSEAGRPVPRGEREREAWLASVVGEAAAAARAGAVSEGPSEALLKAVGPAMRGAAAAPGQAPFMDSATGRKAMRVLASDFATLLHHAEPALASPLAEEYGRALRAAAAAYDERRTLAPTMILRYAEKEYLSESFWGNMLFVPGVPEGERRRRAWMQSVIDSFD